MTTPDIDLSIEPVESGEVVEPVGTVVEHPITPIVSDTTPTPAASVLPEKPELVAPVVQSLDLTMPILEVLTSPNL
ncbi:MAG: acetyl-CoA carboxylase [Actinomyces sp.]|jgi:hypothetical protein|nr:acetyl-CoA carboxylase [Actinomyces sp.]MCI1786591.1 acetyl-CoA carboxylase [Actinomyces sp.]MCI1829888.1 acetyl-CoA carboxylase [Actinomyces sp.]